MVYQNMIFFKWFIKKKSGEKNGEKGNLKMFNNELKKII